MEHLQQPLATGGMDLGHPRDAAAQVVAEARRAACLGISRKALWERRLKHSLPRPRSGGS